MAGKSLAGGEGGIILTNHAELREKLYAYMDMGRWVERTDKSVRLGIVSNFRMPEFTAAILLAQLTRLDEQVETRKRNFTYLCFKSVKNHHAWSQSSIINSLTNLSGELTG